MKYFIVLILCTVCVASSFTSIKNVFWGGWILEKDVNFTNKYGTTVVINISKAGCLQDIQDQDKNHFKVIYKRVTKVSGFCEERWYSDKPVSMIKLYPTWIGFGTENATSIEGFGG